MLFKRSAARRDRNSLQIGFEGTLESGSFNIIIY